MRKIIFSFVLVMSLLIVGCSATNGDESASSEAEEVETLTIDMALFHTENDAFAEIFKEWASVVEEETDGRVVFQPHYSGSLVDLFDTLETVRAGSVDAGILSAGAVSGEIPALGLLEIINVFPDGEAFQNIYRDSKSVLEEIFEENGVKLLFWASGGNDMLAFHKDDFLTKPEDFEGFKMRTAGRWQAEQVSMLGANPVTMDPSQLYMALQNGTVDSTFQVVGLAHAAKIQEVVSKVVSTGMPANSVQWVVNPDVWEKVSDEDKKIIEEISDEIGLASFQMIEESEVETKKQIEETGGEIYVLTDEEREAFQEIFNQVPEKIVEEAGEPGEKLNEILEQYR